MSEFEEDLFQRPVYAPRSSTPRVRARPASMVTSQSLLDVSSGVEHATTDVASELDSVREQIKQLKLQGSPGSRASSLAASSRDDENSRLKKPPVESVLSASVNSNGEPRSNDPVDGQTVPYTVTDSAATPEEKGGSIRAAAEPWHDTDDDGSIPSLTRQTAAERHLLSVIDRARKFCDHDVLVVLLERVVTDTMSLYNHSSEIQSHAIDRVCLSLSDVILQYIDISSMGIDEPARVSRRATGGQFVDDRRPTAGSFSTPLARMDRSTSFTRSLSRHTRTPSSLSRPSVIHNNSSFFDREAPVGNTSLRSAYDRPSSRLTSYSRESPVSNRPSSASMYARRRYDDPP
jgi:hypothetical protein